MPRGNVNSASKRSVRNMDPERVERKRRADREAQSRNRQRQKDLIESLQRENRALKMGADQCRQALAKQVEDLTRSRDELLNELSKMKLKYCPHLLKSSDVYYSSIDTDGPSSYSTPLPDLSVGSSPLYRSARMSQSLSQDHLIPPGIGEIGTHFTHSPSPLVSDLEWKSAYSEPFGQTISLENSDTAVKVDNYDYHLDNLNFDPNSTYSTQFVTNIDAIHPYYYPTNPNHAMY